MTPKLTKNRKNRYFDKKRPIGGQEKFKIKKQRRETIFHVFFMSMYLFSDDLDLIWLISDLLDNVSRKILFRWSFCKTFLTLMRELFFNGHRLIFLLMIGAKK